VYVPATVKSRPTEAPDVAPMSATLAPDGCVSHVTVCATFWNTHVTVAGAPFRVTVTEGGMNCREEAAVTVPGGVFGAVDELPQARRLDTIAPTASVRAVACSIVLLLTKKGGFVG
jgi:hypothetical protein